MKRLQPLFASGRKAFMISLSLGLLVVLMMANLNALIDQLHHPEIPYFDDEHLLVGGISAIVTAISYGLLLKHIWDLRKRDLEIHKLNEELERKVTERTRQLSEMQEELVRGEKLSMLGLIAGGMGNELLNPLGVMNNAVFYLKSIMPDADDTVREYLEIIKKEIDTSRRIISDLLDFSRINLPQIQSVPALDLVKQGLLKCTIPEKVTVELALPETLPIVRVDPHQLGQVLQTIIDNAVQAMAGGGKLTLRVEENDQGVRIRVIDTGEGIATENLAKLFEPFFTTKSRGIGLGLALSKKYAEANGGRIEVESELGKGTTFSLQLPRDTHEG